MKLRSSPMLLGALLCGCMMTTLDAQAPKLLRDINQTAPLTSSRPDKARSPSNTGGHDRSEMLVVGKYAWFTANAPKTGIELYRTTGLPLSATLIKDIRPGTGSSRPLYLQAVKVGSRTLVFFQADDGKTGPELWVSDGTSAGTNLVKDIAAGLGGSWPMLGGSFQGKLWFAANDGVSGTELWVFRMAGPSSRLTTSESGASSGSRTVRLRVPNFCEISGWAQLAVRPTA